MTALASPRPAVSRQGWTAYGLAATTLLLDQASKSWVLGGLHLAERGAVAVLPPFLHFSLVWNRGFSFGLLAEVDLARWGLFIFSVAVAVALALWARRVRRTLPALGIGLIIGGAVGNAADRVRYGAVVDFIDVRGVGFPWIFNVADSAITLGVALLLLDSFLTKSDAPA